MEKKTDWWYQVAETHQQKDGKRMINPLIVECKSKVMRNNILEEEKKLTNANFDDLNISGINNVYINENLTKASRNLLYHTKRFKMKMVGRTLDPEMAHFLLRKKDDTEVKVIDS